MSESETTRNLTPADVDQPTAAMPNPSSEPPAFSIEEQTSQAAESRRSSDSTQPSRSGNSQETAFDLAHPEFLDRFEVQEVLGRGGFGVVYRAWDPQMERDVALKVPHAHLLAEPDFRSRFLREARAVASLHHEAICPSYEVRELDTGECFLVLGFIRGESLAERLARGPLDQIDAVKMTLKIARALQEAHRIGVIHRDLKPANILLNEQGQPVVTDFGLARRVASQDATLTRQGEILGTPAYMPPEQAAGDLENLTAPTDVYSLGATLYEMLTGHRLFGGTVTQVLTQVMRDEPPPPSHSRLDVDPRLEEIVLKAIRKNPTERFPTMTMFAGTLQTLLDRGGPTACDGREPAPHSISQTAVTIPAPALAATGAQRSGTTLIDASAEQPRRTVVEKQQKTRAVGGRLWGLIAAVCLVALGILWATRPWEKTDKPTTMVAARPVATWSPTLIPDESKPTHPPKPKPEANSALLGKWTLFSETHAKKPVSIEFFADGSVEVSDGGHTFGGPTDSYGVEITFKTQDQGPQIDPLAITVKTNNSGLFYSTNPLDLRAEEYWELSLRGDSRAIGNRYEGSYAKTHIEPIALYAPAIAGPPILKKGRWILSRWQMSHHKSKQPITIQVCSDGRILLEHQGKTYGGWEGAGGLAITYHVEPTAGLGDLALKVRAWRVERKADTDEQPLQVGWITLASEELWTFHIGADEPTARLVMDRTTKEVELVEEVYSVTVPLQDGKFVKELRTRTVQRERPVTYSVLLEGEGGSNLAIPRQAIPTAIPDRPRKTQPAIPENNGKQLAIPPGKIDDEPKSSPKNQPAEPGVKLKSPEELFGKEKAAAARKALEQRQTPQDRAP